MDLPTEAKMLPGRFGPNQVQGFLHKILDDLLPKWMSRPSIRQLEGGDIHVGCKPLNAIQSAFVIYQSVTKEHWIVVNTDGQTTYHGCPFSAIRQVVAYYTNNAVDEWIFHNYTCSA
jgi:hypothetical protein